LDKRDQKATLDAIPEIYEDGPPRSLEYFLISDLVDGLISQIKAFTQPSFMYFHVFPPHGPYKAYKHHYQRFSKDKYLPIEKPVHPLIENIKNQEDMNEDRMTYDALIASLDEELGRFFTYFEDSGMKEKSHLFITSDHGEMFERGHVGHWDKMLYEPVLHVPLIVSTPGITARVDVKEKTNNIDLFPTIAHLTNNPTPPWAEGEILPELGGSRNADRSIFTMDVSNNPIKQAIREYSFCLHRGNYKMIKYNYSTYQGTEFYDLAADPEEMKDLYSAKPATAVEMERQLDEKMAEINAPFEDK
jgi:arylsulfatase A-like enzyme